MASSVGTWDMKVTWKIRPRREASNSMPQYFTFNANGTWTAGPPHANQHHGWWLQSGDLAIWVDVTAPQVVWSANIEAGPLGGA